MSTKKLRTMSWDQLLKQSPTVWRAAEILWRRKKASELGYKSPRELDPMLKKLAIEPRMPAARKQATGQRSQNAQRPPNQRPSPQSQRPKASEKRNKGLLGKLKQLGRRVLGKKKKQQRKAAGKR